MRRSTTGRRTNSSSDTWTWRPCSPSSASMPTMTPSACSFSGISLRVCRSLYRDCYEKGALHRSRAEVLRRVFFRSSSPLRSEADHWFLDELRGRYDVVLKFVARHPGCSHGDIESYVRSVSPQTAEQVGGYLKSSSTSTKCSSVVSRFSLRLERDGGGTTCGTSFSERGWPPCTATSPRSISARKRSSSPRRTNVCRSPKRGGSSALPP